MGITNLEVTIQNPANPKKSTKQKLLVDSGAAYSVVPAKVLKKLGIIPTSRRSFILANGETVEWQVGNALFRYQMPMLLMYEANQHWGLETNPSPTPRGI